MIRKANNRGDISYFNEQSQYHREDGPAIEYYSGEKCWFINDLCHRIDGPAVEYISGFKVYYIMGRHLSYEEWLSIKDFPLLW